MDPQATLLMILEGLSSEEPDRDEIRDALLNLANWIGDGGFLPKVVRDPFGSAELPCTRFAVPGELTSTDKST